MDNPTTTQVSTLQETLKLALDVIRDGISTEPCHLDHNQNCQKHQWFPYDADLPPARRDECPARRAARLLADQVDPAPAQEQDGVSLTSDVVLLARHPDTGQWHVLLIERRWYPFAGRYALPGGYVERTETPRRAATRELAEETGIQLDDDTLTEVGTYADPARDPRGRVVSVAYCAQVPYPLTATAGDDAASAAWMPASIALDAPLAFDHHAILRAALARLGVPPFDTPQHSR